jgi:cell division protein FtsB
MDDSRSIIIKDIRNIEEMLEALSDYDRYRIIDMMKFEIESMKKNIKKDKNIEKAEQLKTKVELLKKGIVVYSDCFCEECRYLLNYIRIGECVI